MVIDTMSATAYALGMPLVLRVRELREALGLTQAELAERAGVRRATVNRIENAHVTAIDLEVLEKLGDALRVEPGFLIVRASGGEGSDPTPSKRQRSRR
jgi:transcriptional regulator with XRE-family HTH domain